MAGKGTEEEPWLLDSAENLAYVAFGNNAAGKYYKLTTDIYLNDIEKIDFSTGAVEEGYDAIPGQTIKASMVTSTETATSYTVCGIP